MYDARKVANYILVSYDPQACLLTNIKINKLLFLAHGLHLARRGGPLIKNHFEAWKYGPVVRVIYHEFKEFDKRPVNSLATFLDYTSGKIEPVRWDDIAEPDQYFIRRVCDYYMPYSAGQLVTMTHEEDGPWHQAFNAAPEARGLWNRIPNTEIAAHFRSLVGDTRVQ